MLQGIKSKYRYKLQKVKSFDNNKPTIAFQVSKMDKGGLEEVVLQLTTSKKIREKYNVVIIAEYMNKGYLADIARKHRIPVYSFFKNTKNIPKLIKTLNIKIVHFHYNISGIEEYKKHKIKTLYTIHSNYIWFDKENIGLRNKSYAFVDKFVAVSSQVKEYFCEKFKIDKSKVLVISNGIQYLETNDLVPFPKTKIGFNEKDFILICVASFSPVKDHFAQLKALAEVNKKYKNVKLLLIGNILDQFYFKKMKEMIYELKLENNVKILDYVPKNNIYRYLKMSDCFILTSLTEGFSLATIEAMMFGKPMIVTDVGGARDIIQNNDIGIIVPHAFCDIQELNINKVMADYSANIFHQDNQAKIIDAIENVYLNIDFWKRKSKIGKLKVKTQFNIEHVLESYLIEYDKLLKVSLIKIPT